MTIQIVCIVCGNDIASDEYLFTLVLPSITTEKQMKTNVHSNVCENTPMEFEGQVSTHLQSQHVDDDIVEIEGMSYIENSPSALISFYLSSL